MHAYMLQVEQRLVCLQSHQVRYTYSQQQVLALPIPVDIQQQEEQQEQQQAQQQQRQQKRRKGAEGTPTESETGADTGGDTTETVRTAAIAVAAADLLPGASFSVTRAEYFTILFYFCLFCGVYLFTLCRSCRHLYAPL